MDFTFGTPKKTNSQRIRTALAEAVKQYQERRGTEQAVREAYFTQKILQELAGVYAPETPDVTAATTSPSAVVSPPITTAGTRATTVPPTPVAPVSPGTIPQTGVAGAPPYAGPGEYPGTPPTLERLLQAFSKAQGNNQGGSTQMTYRQRVPSTGTEQGRAVTGYGVPGASAFDENTAGVTGNEAGKITEVPKPENVEQPITNAIAKLTGQQPTTTTDLRQNYLNRFLGRSEDIQNKGEALRRAALRLMAYGTPNTLARGEYLIRLAEKEPSALDLQRMSNVNRPMKLNTWQGEGGIQMVSILDPGTGRIASFPEGVVGDQWEKQGLLIGTDNRAVLSLRNKYTGELTEAVGTHTIRDSQVESAMLTARMPQRPANELAATEAQANLMDRGNKIEERKNALGAALTSGDWSAIARSNPSYWRWRYDKTGKLVPDNPEGLKKQAAIDYSKNWEQIVAFNALGAANFGWGTKWVAPSGEEVHKLLKTYDVDRDLTGSPMTPVVPPPTTVPPPTAGPARSGTVKVRFLRDVQGKTKLVKKGSVVMVPADKFDATIMEKVP